MKYREAYRMELMRLKTIELSALMNKTAENIRIARENKKENRHKDKSIYKHYSLQLRSLNHSYRIQKAEMQSRQMRLFD